MYLNKLIEKLKLVDEQLQKNGESFLVGNNVTIVDFVLA